MQLPSMLRRMSCKPCPSLPPPNVMYLMIIRIAQGILNGPEFFHCAIIDYTEDVVNEMLKHIHLNDFFTQGKRMRPRSVWYKDRD